MFPLKRKFVDEQEIQGGHRVTVFLEDPSPTETYHRRIRHWLASQGVVYVRPEPEQPAAQVARPQTEAERLQVLQRVPSTPGWTGGCSFKGNSLASGEGGALPY